MRNYKLEKLQNGETFITSEKGNSMVPLIHSGQEHKLSPASVEMKKKVLDLNNGQHGGYEND
jgi:hypothetical protein